MIGTPALMALREWCILARNVPFYQQLYFSNEDVRQCVIYDSPNSNARLIGIEYIISAKLFEQLPAEEKQYWHSHVSNPAPC